MTLNECISYLTQLLNACFGAFRLEIWGVPIWMYLAAIMLLSVSVAFLKYVLTPFLNRNGGER